MDHARLEELEAAAWADALSAPSPETQADLGTRAEISSGSAVLRSTALDTALLNRVIGLGAREPVAEEMLGAILSGYESARIERYFVHRPPWADTLGAQLEAAGLTRYHRSWVKFVRGREAVGEARTELAIRVAASDDAQAFGRAFAKGFGLPPGAAAIFSALVGRPRWHAYVAHDDERLAGVGLLFIDENRAYLSGATTLPAFRRRGAQAALMARRLEHALDVGCDTISTETGEPVPGDPQHSYRNMQKAGFRAAYVRENYAPRGVAWS